MASVTVTVLVQDQLAAPVDGVLVRVFLSDGTTFVTEGATGNPTPGSGQVEFTLFGDTPGVDYVIRLSKDGLYWPAGATQTINVTDPPVPNNDFGPYASAVGPSDPLVKLIVSDTELVPGPIEGVRVRLYDAGDVFLTEGDTDVNGEFSLHLDGSASPGTTYIARLSKPGVVFEEPSQTIAVLDPVVPPNTNEFDFSGIVFIPGVLTSSDPDLCLVYGFFANVSGRPAKRLRLEFKPCPNFPTVGTAEVRESSRLVAAYHSYPTLLRDKILTRSVKVDTDNDGFFQVELPRGGVFDVHIQGLEDPIEITEQIYIPDAASALAIDLFYPYVQEVTYDTDPIDLLVDEVAEVGFTLTMSNQQEITDLTRVRDLVSFESGDPTIAEVTLFSENKITVKGVAVGGTTVEVTRNELAVVPSRPALAALIVTPPAVNVT